MGMSGAKVWDAYQQGRIEEIRDYCETDVLNTYLVFLNFERSRGHLDAIRYADECRLVRESLRESGRQHLIDFEAAWHDG
jgi:predicted PolB exonuclease-like 3'-5' exonuclease